MAVSKILLSAAAFAALFVVGAASAEAPDSRTSVVPCASNGSEVLSVFRYPVRAQKNRRYGSVQLRVLVDDDGGVRTVAVSTSSGSPELDRAARIGARNVSLCKPDGKTPAEAGYAQMQVKFKLNSLLASR